jgi:predicted alpha/beta superfamily hydrolase
MTTFQRIPGFTSKYVPARNIDIWRPPEYDAREERTPVIYMHDGQNLFDPTTAYGGVTWGVDEAIARLMQAGRAPGAIVVGMWNASSSIDAPQGSGNNRWLEYAPARPFRSPQAQVLHASLRERAPGMGEPSSDEYLRFIVEEVKPFIDAAYRTRPGRDDTFVMGSSMGGLISLYALTEYPHVFGGAGCLSTHWPVGGDVLVDAMADALPPPGAHKLYFDYGTATLDASYEPFQQRMDERMRAAGYTFGRDWLTRKFEGAEHNEAAWRARVDIPLEFLLGGQ